MFGVMTFGVPVLGEMIFQNHMFKVMTFTFGIPILRVMTFGIKMFGVFDIRNSNVWKNEIRNVNVWSDDIRNSYV